MENLSFGLFLGDFSLSLLQNLIIRYSGTWVAQDPGLAGSLVLVPRLLWPLPNQLRMICLPIRLGRTQVLIRNCYVR